MTWTGDVINRNLGAQIKDQRPAQTSASRFSVLSRVPLDEVAATRQLIARFIELRPKPRQPEIGSAAEANAEIEGIGRTDAAVREKCGEDERMGEKLVGLSNGIGEQIEERGFPILDGCDASAAEAADSPIAEPFVDVRKETRERIAELRKQIEGQ
jgi:hypothetical protein